MSLATLTPEQQARVEEKLRSALEEELDDIYQVPTSLTCDFLHTEATADENASLQMTATWDEEEEGEELPSDSDADDAE